MVEGLENLAKMEYPGRFIIMGMNEKTEKYVVYGLEGRSESSRARELIVGEKTGVIRTSVTDPKQLKKGSPALLIYPAIISLEPPLVKDNYVAVSNGAQTTLISNLIRMRWDSPDSILINSLKEPLFVYDEYEDKFIDITSYEPDPCSTPRINGCIAQKIPEMALSIIKKDPQDGTRQMNLYREHFYSTKGKLISTYTGVNVNPLPSFQGEPLDVRLTGATPQDIAEKVWEVLNPEHKVSVACVFLGDTKHPAIINKYHSELEDKK